MTICPSSRPASQSQPRAFSAAAGALVSLAALALAFPAAAAAQANLPVNIQDNKDISASAASPVSVLTSQLVSAQTPRALPAPTARGIAFGVNENAEAAAPRLVSLSGSLPRTSDTLSGVSKNDDALSPLDAVKGKNTLKISDFSLAEVAPAKAGITGNMSAGLANKSQNLAINKGVLKALGEQQGAPSAPGMNARLVAIKGAVFPAEPPLSLFTPTVIERDLGNGVAKFGPGSIVQYRPSRPAANLKLEYQLAMAPTPAYERHSGANPYQLIVGMKARF